MDKVLKYAGVVALVAIVLLVLIGLNSGGSNTNILGGTTNYDAVEAASLGIGSGCADEMSTCTGTLVTQILEGTCNPTQNAAGSHAASSSMEYFCAVTGVESGDRIFISLPAGAGANASGAGSIYGGFLVNGAFATTSDKIGMSIYNATGAATSSFPQATTSVMYRVTR